LVLYGARLCLFLLYRERIPFFQKLREKIEERATSQGGRLNRLPFVLSCSLLYLGLVAPVALAALAGQRLSVAGCPVALLFRGCMVAMYAGWVINAAGDAWKSVRKAVKGDAALVTGGPFSLLRHPNYTGEQLMWTANFAAGLAAWLSLQREGLRAGPLGWLALSALGYAGIMFVLMQATRSLERRHREKYGSDSAYGEWVSRTWAGLALPDSSASQPAGQAAAA